MTSADGVEQAWSPPVEPAVESGPAGKSGPQPVPPAESEPAYAPAPDNGDEAEVDAEPDLATVAEREAEELERPDTLAPLRADLATLSEQVGELARLRTHDADLADRMHAEIVRLRGGELATALAPLLGQLLRLRDRMLDLADTDDLAGMVATQLEQILDTSADVHAFSPQPGDAFDPRLHQGAARTPTEDDQADGTVARTIRSGFVRGDGSLVRVAEVDVFRYLN